MDAWKTYKLAHRTRGLIAKTRRALETLSREKDPPNGTPRQLGDSMEDGFSESDANDAAALGTPGSSGGGLLWDGGIDDFNTVADEQTLQERFWKDVCDDDDQKDNASAVDRKSSESRVATPPTGIGGSDEFWTIYKGTATNKRPDSARGRYIGHCEDASMLVLPVLDLKRPSRYNQDRKALRYDNYYFGDARAEALGDALQLLTTPIQDLSMRNVGITDTGSSAIVNGVALTQLQHLDFSENRIGSKGVATIFKGLRDPHVNLKTLNLGNNQLGDQAVKTLMQCLVNRCTIEHLDLQRNQIFHAARAIGELLRITTPLRSLNLAWNNIRGEPAQYLAKCMMENLTLASLNLADNTLGNNGNADAELAACLATNKSLRYLNVANNHIHGKSVLVFVHGLQQNATLDMLVLRGNPIGCLGTEAIVRSVANGSISKCEIDIADCNVEIQDATRQTVIYGGGSYTLNLADLSDVVLLRELLLLAWKNKCEISEATFNGQPYTFVRRDEKSFVNTLPGSSSHNSSSSQGVLQLKMQLNYDRHEDMLPAAGLSRILQLLERSFGAFREGDDAAKLLCIRLLAEEYMMTVDQANALLSLFRSHTSQVERASAAAILIPQIHDASSDAAAATHEVYDCESMVIPDEFFEDKDKDGKIDVCGDICMVIGLKNLSDLEQAQVETRVGKWISFNVRNPTGRYRLNMANPIDRRILMRILETNRHDRRLRQHYKLLDTSQHGAALQPLQGGFRNVRLNHLPVVMNTTWQFPRLGILEFDFVQSKRPYVCCTALSDLAFDKFLREFKQLDVSAEVKLIGLRSISSRYFFNCSQLQRLMEHFGTFERDRETGALFRADVFIILFARIVDEWNLSEALALLDLATKQHVLDRLGHLHCFHPLQLAETYENLQLSVFDQRQLVLLLVRLATSGECELCNVVLNNATVVEPDEWKTWTSDDRVPSQGVLSCAMRTTLAEGQNALTEAQLPATSARKKLLQTLLLKPESNDQEQHLG
ncbi:hypothetical protein PINS_up001189 [Pythium insidiosum]|nr:hypothetical protein PINS_up001189 [Pythium insidiosum]